MVSTQWSVAPVMRVRLKPSKGLFNLGELGWYHEINLSSLRGREISIFIKEGESKWSTTVKH